MKTTKISLRTLIFGSFTMLIGMLVTGCSQDQASPTTDTVEPNHTAAAKVPNLEAFIIDAKPEGAVSVTQARASAAPGKPIVVTGQIGASDQPFGNSFATFILGDEAIDFCDELPGDTCPKPWDACCEDPDKLAASRASVQLTLDGTPIPGSIKGVAGLKELDHVVVAGVVAPTSTSENLIIHASGIYRIDK